MRIAVTGASGFVGRHVVAALVARGADVVALARGGAPAAPGVASRAIDVAAPPRRAFDAIGKPDALVHLAWGGLPNYGSLHHVERELPVHAGFLSACLDGGLGRLAVAGTCLEYGLAEGALGEDAPAAPTTAYGRAKHALHAHLQRHCAATGCGLAWFRLFYLHGPGQSPNSLLPRLDAAVAAGERTFAMSPGDQSRDFIGVADAADAMVRVVLAHADPGTVNVASGRATRVVDLARSRLQALGATLELALGALPYPDYEPMHAWGRRERLDALLGDA